MRHVCLIGMRMLLLLLLGLAGLAGCTTLFPSDSLQPRNPTPNIPAAKDIQLSFTPQEKAWLAQHPVVRMGSESNFPPYEFLDNAGNFTGISADYRELLEKRLGIDIQVEQYPSFAMVRDRLKSKDLDLVLMLTPTQERRQFTLFTQPFFDYQLVIVTRDDHPLVLGLDEFNGKQVGVVEGYASSEYLARKYPGLDLVPYPTVEEGVLAVSTGKVDAFVNEVFATVYPIRNKSISNVKIAAALSSDLPGYAIGVRDDWPELVTILNKALPSITMEERSQLSQKWLSVKFEQGIDYSLLTKVLAGGLAILGVFVYWNRRLSKEVAIRKRIEEELRKVQHHLEGLVRERTANLETKNLLLEAEIAERERAQRELEESETNFRAMAENASDAILIAAGPDGNFVFANRWAEGLTGYTAAELGAMGFQGLIHPGEWGRMAGLLEKVLPVDALPTPDETVFVHKNQGNTFVEMTTTHIRWQGKTAVMAIARDISERKKREAEIIQQKNELEVMADLSAAVRQVNDPAEMAALFLRRNLELLEMEWGLLAVLNGDDLLFLADQGLPALPESDVAALKMDLYNRLLAGTPVFLSSEQQSPLDAQPAFESAVLPGACARVFIPLKSFDCPIGVLALFAAAPRAFSPQVRRLAAAIADQAGYALERMQAMTTLEVRVASRTRDLSTLYQVMTAASQSVELEPVLSQVLHLALAAVTCSTGCIQLLKAEESSPELVVYSQVSASDLRELLEALIQPALVQQILSTSRPLLVPDSSGLDQLPGPASQELPGELAGVPLRTGGDTLGILWVYSQQVGHLTQEDISLLASIGEHVGTAIEKARLRERTQQLAILEERQRLARDLHDSATQLIYSLLLLAGCAKKSVTAQDIDSSYQFVRRIEEIARQVIKELRLLIFELRPLDLQQEGLPGALQLRLASVEQRAGIHTRLLVEEYTAAPVLVEEGLFRIAIEALNNSLKHAEASEVTVQLRRSTGKIMLEILDNGKGFAPGMEDNGGNGLPNMRARALAIGGEMEIASAPGAGTTVIISLEDLNGR